MLFNFLSMLYVDLLNQSRAFGLYNVTRDRLNVPSSFNCYVHPQVPTQENNESDHASHNGQNGEQEKTYKPETNTGGR